MHNCNCIGFHENPNLRFFVDESATNSGNKASDQHWVFVSKNATTVKAHIGSTAVLPCLVKKDSLYGMVSCRQT